jgi:insertion element IS1 protein InsB
MAFGTYPEGLGFGAIARLPKISYGTVCRRTKKRGEANGFPVGRGSAETVGPDETAHLCRPKKTCERIRIAVDGPGKRFLAFVRGDRSTQTGSKPRDRIGDSETNGFASEYRKSYEEFVPREKHLQTKAETRTSEGYDGRIRHYSAGFERKGKCYGKSESMIITSLNLLFLKPNGELYVLN